MHIVCRCTSMYNYENCGFASAYNRLECETRSAKYQVKLLLWTLNRNHPQSAHQLCAAVLGWGEHI